MTVSVNPNQPAVPLPGTGPAQVEQEPAVQAPSVQVEAREVRRLSDRP